MMVTADAIIEYRAVWPGGEVAQGLSSDNRKEFFEQFDGFIRKLQGLSIPRSCFPHVEARIVEKVRYEWKPYGDTEKDFAAAQQTSVHVTSGPINTVPKHKGPTPEQVARVQAGKYQYHDPCVICGEPFNLCQHTNDQTEALVNEIRKGNF